MARHSANQLRSIACGRWVEVLAAAGIPPSHLDGRGHACPRCGGQDRFAAFPGVPQRGAVHCRRCFTRGTVPSPGDGIATLMWCLNASFPETLEWLANYLGVRDSSDLPAAPRRSSVPKFHPAVSGKHVEHMTRFVADAMQRISAEMIYDLALKLGVNEASLRALCVGYSADHRATTWPMRDGDGQVIGVRFRAENGNKKWSLRGSQAGLFLSREHRPAGSRLFIVEGASDAAAAICLGSPMLGRPSCHGSTDLIRRYISRYVFNEVVVIADADDAGRVGAIRLARDLAASGVATDVITPPDGISDLREWLRHGATPDDIDSSDSLQRFPAKPQLVQLAFGFADVATPIA